MGRDNNGSGEDVRAAEGEGEGSAQVATRSRASAGQLEWLSDALSVVSAMNNLQEECEAANEGANEQDEANEVEAAVQPPPKPARKKANRRDRVFFTLGIVNACLNSFLVGYGIVQPLFICLLYSVKVCVLFPYRWSVWKPQGMHYFLCDFCYYANSLLVGFLFSAFVLTPSVGALLGLWFLCHGPLAWSVVTFNNKLMFHSIQHIISLMIHFTPSAVLWALRWGGDTHVRDLANAHCATHHMGTTLGLLILYATPLYLVWAVAYYFVVFVARQRTIKSRGYQTLFSDLMSEGSKNPAKKFLRRFSSPVVQQVMYMATHMVFALLTGSLSCLFFCSQGLHFVFVLWCGSMSAWNASETYMRAF